jgi:hypothetical protein
MVTAEKPNENHETAQPKRDILRTQSGMRDGASHPHTAAAPPAALNLIGAAQFTLLILLNIRRAYFVKQEVRYCTMRALLIARYSFRHTQMGVGKNRQPPHRFQL